MLLFAIWIVQLRHLLEWQYPIMTLLFSGGVLDCTDLSQYSRTGLGRSLERAKATRRLQTSWMRTSPWVASPVTGCHNQPVSASSKIQSTRAHHQKCHTWEDNLLAKHSHKSCVNGSTTPLIVQQNPGLCRTFANWIYYQQTVCITAACTAHEPCMEYFCFDSAWEQCTIYFPLHKVYCQQLSSAFCTQLQDIT